jgi:hypothetical protein
MAADSPEPIAEGRVNPDGHCAGLQADSVCALSKRFEKVRIHYEAPSGLKGAAVRVDALNAETGNWDRVEVPRAHRRTLAEFGIAVVAKETRDVLDTIIPAQTQLDRLAGLADVLLNPESLVPRLLGIFVEGIARHAGMPDPVARLAGDAAEQAIGPLFEPHGALGDLLAGIDDFSVTCDIANGQVTYAVIDLALDRLADELKKRTSTRTEQ